MSGKQCIARKRMRDREKKREQASSRMAALVRWYKASDLGIPLGVCGWRGAECCTEPAKWVMESDDRRWVLCHHHAAELHQRPWTVGGFVGRQLFRGESS